MLPARVGRIPALLNTTSYFPTHAGIFYHFFRHICILQEYLNRYRNISYTFFRISYTCRKHVSGTFEKCGPFFYLGVAQLEKLFSYLNENMFKMQDTHIYIHGYRKPPPAVRLGGLISLANYYFKAQVSILSL